MVTAIRDLVRILSEADPNDKAEVYAQIGLSLTYQPQKS